MKNIFQALPVTDDVYWVGALDWSVRNFHGYWTGRGTTYNAFLILADKITLMDTVKAPFKDELLARIASVIDPTRIDFIVSNHSEPDHAGCLADVIQAVQPEKTFASANGVKALAANFALEGITAVADGEELSLGNRRLTFLETKMCHWPDSMVSYLPEQKLLFSQDGFGMHLASYERFDDQLPQALLENEAGNYYANILLPLSTAVQKALAKITDLNLELKIIAPDHGPIWRKNPKGIVAHYARWASQKRTNKAVVVYDTMWTSTERMARAIGEGLAAGGAHVKLLPMSGCHRSDVATEILDAGALVVGAPTMNNQMFPTMADVMSYLKGLKPRGLIGAAFGSYGWGGESPRRLRAELEDMNVQLLSEPIAVQYAPTAEDLSRCYQLGLSIAEKLKD